MAAKTDWQLKANVEEETSLARMAHARELAGTEAALDAAVEAAFDRGIAYAYEARSKSKGAGRHLKELSQIKALVREIGACPGGGRASNPPKSTPAKALGEAANMVGKQSMATSLGDKVMWGMDAAFYAGAAWGYATARGKKSDQEMALSHYDDALTHLREAVSNDVRRATNPGHGRKPKSVRALKARLLK